MTKSTDTLKGQFKYWLDQKVKTNLGNEGIITSILIEDSRISYWVKQKENENSSWFQEDHIELIGIAKKLKKEVKSVTKKI
jgi:hypothetical protein